MFRSPATAASSVLVLGLALAGCRSEGEVDASVDADEELVSTETSASVDAPVYEVSRPRVDPRLGVQPETRFVERTGVETETVPVARTGPRSISVEDARARMNEGAILVCAYDDAKCAQYPVEGAITYSELEARIDTLEPDQEILFYCSCPSDASARKRATELELRGFRTSYVEGGYESLIEYR